MKLLMQMAKFIPLFFPDEAGANIVRQSRRWQRHNIALAGLILLYLPQTWAALAIDRSRIVINEGTKSVAINVTNKNVQQPYLAQAWIESESGEKVHEPFMVLPPLQRVEADSRSKLRIEAVKLPGALPDNREQVFYLNLREIPPKSEQSNVLMLAVQTRIKIFYRPKSLAVGSAETSVPGAEKITMEKRPEGYVIHNPTAYYFSFVNLRSSPEGSRWKDFSPVMVPPFGSASLDLRNRDPGHNPVLSFVNDYGSQQWLPFFCNGQFCQAGKPVSPGQTQL